MVPSRNTFVIELVRTLRPVFLTKSVSGDVVTCIGSLMIVTSVPSSLLRKLPRVRRPPETSWTTTLRTPTTAVAARMAPMKRMVSAAGPLAISCPPVGGDAVGGDDAYAFRFERRGRDDLEACLGRPHVGGRV